MNRPLTIGLIMNRLLTIGLIHESHVNIKGDS